MILDVVKVQQVQQEDKPDVFKVTLKGSDFDYAKMTVTIESTEPSAIKKFVPMFVGERRSVQFRTLDRTLDEFTGPVLDADDIEAVQKSRYEREVMAEGDKLLAEMNESLEKRKQAAAEQE